MDPAPDPYIIKQKYSEKPSFFLFCDFFTTFIFEKLCKYSLALKSDKQKKLPS
jgi:hypothetical protein